MGLLDDVFGKKSKKTITAEEQKLDLLKKIEELDKFPSTPIPSLPQFQRGKEDKQEDTMVVNVSKKEKTLEEENKELKDKLQQLEKGTTPGKDSKVVKEAIEKSKEIVEDKEPEELTEIEKTVKEFYDEYGVFNATASNKTIIINLLFGILQELKKLNNKKGK
jgi:hypothetical protein